MSRLFWVGVGAVGGYLVLRKVRRLATRATPAAVTEAVSGAAGRARADLRSFVADVRVGAAQREAELRAALGLTEEPGPPPGNHRRS